MLKFIHLPLACECQAWPGLARSVQCRSGGALVARPALARGVQCRGGGTAGPVWTIFFVLFLLFADL